MHSWKADVQSNDLSTGKKTVKPIIQKRNPHNLLSPYLTLPSKLTLQLLFLLLLLLLKPVKEPQKLDYVCYTT